MQHQAQSPAASLSSKSASLVDDDDSSDSQEGEQASVVGVESNDGLNDGLSKYERQRQERVDRNNQRLFELGLGPPVSAGGDGRGSKSCSHQASQINVNGSHTYTAGQDSESKVCYDGKFSTSWR